MRWVFDLCGTLYRENTTMAFVDSLDGHTDLAIRYIQARKVLPLRILNKGMRIFHLDLLRRLAAHSTKGRTWAQLQADAARLPHLLTPVEASQALLKECLAKQEDVLIFSASFDFIVRTLADHLGVEQVRSTRLGYDPERRGLGFIQEDMLGRKHLFADLLLGTPFNLVTDNLDDAGLVRMAQRAFILSRRKHLAFWKGFPNATVIDLIDP